MSNIKIYENIEFGKIRVEEIGENPWFVAKDICKSLDLTNITETLKRLDKDELSTTEVIDSIGIKQRMHIVNESGLYNLILQSRKPEAKKFKKWITNEVIPSIRKNGGYLLGQENMSEEELMAKALLVAQNKIAEKDRQIKEAKPKVLFANCVSGSKKSILIREMAKYLKQSGYDTGEQRLFEELRKRGFLVSRKGADYNTPTQKSMDMGLFQLKETVVTHSNGFQTISKTPLITGRGQVYFINLFMKEVDENGNNKQHNK